MTSPIQTLAPGIKVIASPQTWMEGAAIQQLTTTAGLAGMRQVVGMPDLHPGRGYPVGAAFFSEGRLYPALVGNDIGCGMSLWGTDLPTAKLHLDKLERRWRSMDDPLDETDEGELLEPEWKDHPHRRALGTLGGGNHFAELLRIDTEYDGATLSALGFTPKTAVLLVHSGSRGLGEAILRKHVDDFGHHGLEGGSKDAAEYLSQHQDALLFAAANRRCIAKRSLARLRIEGSQALDLLHNFVEPTTIGGVSGWLHRKGAAAANAGVVVIPGSRGDHSYLVEPIPSEKSLFSLAHGAGRKWGRADCKGRLSGRYKEQDLQRTVLGSRVICEDRALIFEEAPEAYKKINSVIDDLVAAGLIRLLARMTPILTYKTRRGNRDCS
jgi:release factor H-coupled RctB family protein